MPEEQIIVEEGVLKKTETVTQDIGTQEDVQRIINSIQADIDSCNEQIVNLTATLDDLTAKLSKYNTYLLLF